MRDWWLRSRSSRRRWWRIARRWRKQVSGDLDAKRLHDAQRQARLDADADQVRASYPLGETASAAERVDALIAHLNAHPSHYRYALLQALPIGEQMQELARLGVPTDLVEPRILGMVQGAGANDDLLAVPLNTALEPALKAIRNRFLDENDAITKLCVSRAVRMPTPGTAIEARLGDCDAAEDFVMQTRAIELATRAAQLKSLQATARQQELEADRFAQRIADGELEDPTPEPGGLHVTIDKPAP